MERFMKLNVTKSLAAKCIENNGEDSSDIRHVRVDKDGIHCVNENGKEVALINFSAMASFIYKKCYE